MLAVRALVAVPVWIGCIESKQTIPLALVIFVKRRYSLLLSFLNFSMFSLKQWNKREREKERESFITTLKLKQLFNNFLTCIRPSSDSDCLRAHQWRRFDRVRSIWWIKQSSERKREGERNKAKRGMFATKLQIGQTSDALVCCLLMWLALLYSRMQQTSSI